MTEEVIFHFGVKGMKWGVRKKESKSSTKPKSDRRVRLEGKLINKGFNPEDAAKIVDRKIKTEKAIVIGAGVTLATVAAAYAARKIGRDFVGVNIKAGTTLQHVTNANEFQLQDGVLFTTFKNVDKKEIHGLFPMAKKVNLNTVKDIKAPSNYEGRKILSKVVGSQKTLTPKEYAAFNYRYFYSNKPADKVVSDKFFKAIKDAGYNAVLDPKPSGYRVLNTSLVGRMHQPLIVMDAANQLRKGSVSAVTQVDKERAATSLGYKLAAKSLATLGAVPATIATAIVADTNQQRNIGDRLKVDKYLKDNPGSSLSRSEISAMLSKK